MNFLRVRLAPLSSLTMPTSLFNHDTDEICFIVALISRGVTHDALVLSHRLTRDEEGRKVLNGRGFLRYWCKFSIMSHGNADLTSL